MGLSQRRIIQPIKRMAQKGDILNCDMRSHGHMKTEAFDVTPEFPGRSWILPDVSWSTFLRLAQRRASQCCSFIVILA